MERGNATRISTYAYHFFGRQLFQLTHGPYYWSYF
jgi:hypothetical protein